MYTTNKAVSCILHAIKLCAQRKMLHQGNTLLIEAPLLSLPSGRWEEIKALFNEEVKALSFCEVYLTAKGDNDDICLKIK